MTTLRIHVEGLAEVRRNVAAGPAAIDRAVHDGLLDSVQLLEREAKRNILRGHAVNFGRLLASLTHDVEPLGASWRGVVGTNVAYAPHVEYGTAPHWPPWGPGSALRLWCKRKLHNEQLAYVVARAIARHGTRPRLFLQRAFESQQGRVLERMRAAVARAIGEMR